MKQKLVGILCFKEIHTLAKKKKERETFIVLALSAKDVLKLMILMIITYLSIPAWYFPLQLMSILQLQ